MKRFLALILCLVMVLSLVACGGGETSAEDLALVENVLADAMTRREAILNSPTEIVKSDEYIPGETYTGTAYYVSNNGSDNNNGLSPETPFATLEPFKGKELQYGDAVLFERGGLWRCEDVPWPMMRIDGITYSTYGEGEKPKLYYSPENGAGEEKWTLVHEDGEKKIWQFHADMTEVGAIVLNDDTVAIRQVAWWDGEKYYRIDNTGDHVVGNRATEELYDWREHLEDMQCFPEIFYPETEDRYIFVTGENEHGETIYAKGKLYFRCDAGNPGDLYDSIEFISPYYFLDGMANNTVVDNLSIAYSGSVFCSGPDGANCTIQNCEVSWMGGCVEAYDNKGNIQGGRTTLNQGCYTQQGGCIALNASGCTAKNNYLHHGFQEAASIEIFEDGQVISDILISGNLAEYCGSPYIVLRWGQDNATQVFSNCVFDDNIALFTGEKTRFNNINMLSYETVFSTKPSACPHDGTLAVRNNVFAFTEYAESLVYINRYDPDYAKIYDSNTYVQYSGQGTFAFFSDTSEPVEVKHMKDSFITKWLGDTAPTTALVKKEDVDALRQRLGY